MAIACITDQHVYKYQLHESGIAAPSYTVLQGAYCLRVAITNHRTTTADLEMLIEAVLKIGKNAMRFEAAV